jgi:hypothetical protein
MVSWQVDVKGWIFGKRFLDWDKAEFDPFTSQILNPSFLVEVDHGSFTILERKTLFCGIW